MESNLPYREQGQVVPDRRMAVAVDD